MSIRIREQEMKGALKMKERIQSFFINRNGADDFSKFLTIASLVFLLLGRFQSFFTAFGFAVMIFCLFRMLSRNLYKRSTENDAYLKMRNDISKWFVQKKHRLQQQKTHRFFKCPSCKQVLRVPKGKGKIAITCSKCHEEFIRKS